MQIHNNQETLATMPPVRNSPRFMKLTVHGAGCYLFDEVIHQGIVLVVCSTLHL